ncbi:MAG: CpXC domain-containing protein [Phototrophicaceae bacterium]
MTQPTQTTLQCSNCGTPNAVVMRRVIDVQNDPQGKNALLSGQINQFQCQNCGTVNSVSSPLLYHDASKEMLIAFVPMDVAMRRGSNEEQMVGQLMNELTGTLPKEQFRSYMFNPKRALTMKGLIEQILEADGVTPEMMAEQQKRVALVQKLFEADSEEKLTALIAEHDDQIDVSVFQTISLMAQRMIQTGQQQAVGHLAAIQQILLEESTFGKELEQRQQAQEEVVRTVAAELEQLDENATRSDFLDIAISYAGDEDKLQALVGLIRPAFDETLFAEFAERINQASAEDRAMLEGVRDTLQEFVQQVDQQTEMLMQQKVQFLQSLLNSPNYEQIMIENATLIDDNFMGILTANIQEAERRKDIQSAARLSQIYESAVNILQSQMSPELIFINDLLMAEDDNTVQAIITERIGNFSHELMDVVDAVEGLLIQQGQQDAVQRLTAIRGLLATALS